MTKSKDPLIQSAHLLNVANFKELAWLLYPELAKKFLDQCEEAEVKKKAMIVQAAELAQWTEASGTKAKAVDMKVGSGTITVVKEFDERNFLAEPSHFLIRFNTKHGDTNLVWRIFQDGAEVLATDFRITSPMYSETSVEHGVTKYNVACDGFLFVDEQGVAHIAP